MWGRSVCKVVSQVVTLHDVCVCVCVVLTVCLVLVLLLCIIVYYFRGMYECVYMFVFDCIMVLYYYYCSTVLHYVRYLERICGFVPYKYHFN